MKTVLVVEDNNDLREIFCRLLSEKGFAVTSASNGKEALPWVRKQKFDCILSDVQMPIMDGIGLIKEIKQPPYFFPNYFFFMSAEAKLSSEQIKVLGADDIFSKSDEFESLVDKLIRYLKSDNDRPSS